MTVVSILAYGVAIRLLVFPITFGPIPIATAAELVCPF